MSAGGGMACETDSFTVGKAQIHRVEELSLSFPMDMLKVPDALIERHRDWLFPRWFDAAGNWTMVVQSWIAIVDGLVVVIDPCVGNSRPLPAFPVFDMLDTPFIERFGATGIRPEQVDAVICTHLHSDHCGWNTTLRDGRFVPTFPNAKYYMARREFDRWDPRRPGHLAVDANAGVFERSVQPVLEAGLVELIPADHRISPSLAVCEAHGHTAGHVALHLASAGREAWFTGDCFHHPIELLHPEIDAGTCEDFATALATRQRLIEAIVSTGALIVPGHFAAPHAGYLRESDGERRFEPLASRAA